MPHLNPEEAKAVLGRRHAEWTEFQESWRWLYDSYEGGDRYRYADYFRGPFDPWRDPLQFFGWDSETGEGVPFDFATIVRRNLVPHRSEKGRDGRDLYVLRLNRTPIPALVEFVVTRYLSRIFSQQVTRTGPAEAEAWWEDADGCGSSVGQWVRQKVGPLVLVLGQIDLVFGRPEADAGELAEVYSKADLKAKGLDKVVASYILPENMVWWRLDRRGRYLECLVHERGDDGGTVWRHWTPTDSNAYTPEGAWLESQSFEHKAGCVPVVRVFDDRLLRCRNVGKSRLWTVADNQKSIYNRNSELVLGDIQQSHAVLQGPEDFFTGDSKVPVGPGGALPKRRSPDGNSYVGWDFIPIPQGGAEATRLHVQDDLDTVMRHAALLKPAGMTSGTTVAQSGLSKSFDAREGNDLLSEVAETLAEVEREAARMAIRVARDGSVTPADLDAVSVGYPREYGLFTASDLSTVLADLQALVGMLGVLPETEAEILKRLVAVILPGIDAPRLAELHAEVDQVVANASAERDRRAEAVGADQVGEVEAGEDSTVDPSIPLSAEAGYDAQAMQLIYSSNGV